MILSGPYQVLKAFRTRCKTQIPPCCFETKLKPKWRTHVVSTPHDPIACRTMFSSNNFKWSFSIWRLWRNFPPIFITIWLHCIEACRHSFRHSSLKVLPHNFNQDEVWTLTWPLQHLDSFLFSAILLYMCLGSLSCWMTQFQASFSC